MHHLVPRLCSSSYHLLPSVSLKNWFSLHLHRPFHSLIRFLQNFWMHYPDAEASWLLQVKVAHWSHEEGSLCRLSIPHQIGHWLWRLHGARQKSVPARTFAEPLLQTSSHLLQTEATDSALYRRHVTQLTRSLCFIFS